MATARQSAGQTGGTNTQKVVALLFGAVLAVVGILGFIPQLVVDDKLLGIFGITPLHNVVHLSSGVVGLAAGYGASGRSFNRYFGLIYVLVFVVGVAGVIAGIELVTGTGTLGLNIDWADNVLHLAIAVVLAGVGYGVSS